MQINKIKIDNKGSKLTISYQQGEDKIEIEKDTRKFGMQDSFKKAVESLKQYFLEICELDTTAGQRTTIYGCTFTTWKDGGGPLAKVVSGICISAGVNLLKGTGVVCMNSPHRINDFYGDNGDHGQLMPVGMIADVEVLKNEIVEYLNGNWIVQADLFNQDKNEKSKEEKNG